MKKQHKLNKLVQALTEKKVTHFSMRKSGKRWMTRSAIVLALAGGTGIVATVNPSIFSTIVHALTLPSGSTQIGSIGKAPVIQTDNNSFASMQPLFDAIIGTNQPSFILGDTIDGTGGKAIGWNSNTSLSDSWLTISDADSHTSGASGLSYQTIHYGLGTADGYQDSDKYNYISSKGQTFKVKNVGTAYDTKTKKNVPVSMEVKVNGATYYDSESSSTPRDVFGDGFRLLVAARNNNGNITLGYMVSMDGIPNPGSGQGNEGGGSGGGTGEAIGAASGIPESVNATITMYREDTKENLPEDTLMAMKVSDVDAGQAANVSTNGVHGFIVSKPTNLEIKDNVLTAKGNDTVVNDPKNLSANSYIALKSDNSFFLNFKDSNGNQKQGSIIEALFGNMGPVSPREPLGFISIDKSTDGFDKNPWNENYGFDKLEFEVIDKDGKVVDTIKLDKNGKGKSIGLPPGDYKLHEKSTDWSSTGQTVRPDETTAVSAGDTTTVKLKNKVVVGQNTLEKTDKDTGLEQNGKGVLKTAKYAYFYNDDSIGSSPHKKGDPVKWSDKPGPKLLEGEKVTSAIIGGETVDFGDNVVIDVADDSLKIALGNLPLGKFYSLEVDAGEGYVTDPTKHEFEIKETDPNTQNIVTPNTSSKEQLIKAKVAIEKMVTLPGSQGGSGYNGIEFTAEPMEGTVAEAVKFVTGVNPTTGDDGYASQELSYGDWKISETKGVEGYEDVEPVYIHMETDTEKDILTISASHNEDFSKPFSKRTFSLKDSSTGSNPNGEGTVGEVTPEVPTISLSTLHFNDNPETPKEPSIDIEKANDTLPNPGEGNHKDKDNNGGENDRDTPDTALEVEAGKTTAIKFRFTNNGTEALTHLKVSDKTIEGGISIKDPTWFFNGEKLSTNKDGELVTKDGKLLELKPDEFVTGEGTLPALSDGKLHGDEVTVGGIGVESGKEVGDEDKWYGKPPKEEPSIDIEKADSKAPEAGEGNHKDKPNNAGENDHDTDDTAKELEENKATEIFFKTTNNGTEPLTHLKIVDKTIAGKVNVKNIKLTYREKPLKVNKDGELTTEDGKLLVLNPGETIEGKGTLEGLAAGDIHGDNVTVDGIGVHSGKKVGDDDNWYGKVKPKETPQTPEQPKNNTFNISLPKTGMKAQTLLTAIAAVIAVIVAGLGTFFYRKNKMK